jgi:drug/metabolite transporter (DMT)-like permease
MYLPIIGSFLEATGTILDKRNMQSKGINYKNYTLFWFLAAVIVMLPFIYFFWRIDLSSLLEWKNLSVFVGIILLAILANLSLNFALKREDLTEMEPIRVLFPFFTILFAFLIYPDERNWTIVILGLIAAAALVFAHVKKHHFSFNKYMIATLLSNVFFALELTMSKYLLPIFSPLTFYFLRCFFVLLIIFPIFKSDFRKIDNKLKVMIFLSGLIWVVYRIILYFGYEIYGIILTTTLFILTPVLIMLYAVVFKKEKMNWKQVLSTIIILACVIGAIVLSA